VYYKILKISLFKKLKIKLFVKKNKKQKIKIFFLKENPKLTHNYKQNMLVPRMSMKFSK